MSGPRDLSSVVGSAVHVADEVAVTIVEHYGDLRKKSAEAQSKAEDGRIRQKGKKENKKSLTIK